MKVLVCGSRTWTDVEAISRELACFPGDTTVIHGAAKGADAIADKIASQLGFKVIVFPAFWEEKGRAAGPLRNLRMLAEGEPDLVLAFHKEGSKGTAHMIVSAQRAGIEVRIFDEQGRLVIINKKGE